MEHVPIRCDSCGAIYSTVHLACPGCNQARQRGQTQTTLPVDMPPPKPKNWKWYPSHQRRRG